MKIIISAVLTLVLTFSSFRGYSQISKQDSLKIELQQLRTRNRVAQYHRNLAHKNKTAAVFIGIVGTITGPYFILANPQFEELKVFGYLITSGSLAISAGLWQTGNAHIKKSEKTLKGK